MERIYCISGLGADHRLFKNLSVPGYTLVPVPWAPFGKNDDMGTYASKMLQSVGEQEPIILGLSFGGMLATEISNQVRTKKTIIISSAKTRFELGYRNWLLRQLSKSGIVPTFFFNKPDPIQLYFLGATSGEEKALLKQVIRDANPDFVKWAINTLLMWKNETYSPGIIHIHGTKDKVIKPGKVRPDYWIEGGTHIMIYNRAPEISKIIAGSLL